MSDAEIEEESLKLTSGVFNRKQAQNALELLWRMEEVEDVNQIVRGLMV